MSSKEKVLVVGGAGYVGSHAALALHDAGMAPVVFDNLSLGHRHNVQWGELIVGDIIDTQALTQVLQSVRPCAVMHFAASTEVGLGERDPLRFYQNNVAGTLSLLRAMQAAGVGHLVFSSTCAVYGQADPPLRETLQRNAASVYGRSKAMVEQILEDCARIHGVHVAILRYFNACGADALGRIGEEHDPETHLIPNALKAAFAGTPPLKLFGTDYPTPDGTALRDYIHVTDLGVAHVAALDLIRAKGGLHHINLGTGKPLSVRDIIAAIGRVTGTEPPYELAPRRPGDVAVLTADVSTARDLLGFEARHSDVDTIVATAWQFHKTRWQANG